MKEDVTVQTDLCKMLSSGSSESTSRSSSETDLLAVWEDFLGWSENTAAARKMQEEMITLKHALNRFGNQTSYELLDAEPSIQFAIESLQDEKIQMQNYRTSMLRLNASVHSWLTREERKLQTACLEMQLKASLDDRANATLTEENSDLSIEQTKKMESEQGQDNQKEIIYRQSQQAETYPSANMSVGTLTGATTLHREKAWKLHMNSENEFHKHLKSEVSDMYSAWDEADARISMQLEALTASLLAWRQLECGLLEFQQVLGQDRGTLQGLEGALKNGQATPVELAKNVKLVAKLLSEKVNISQEHLAAVHEHLDPNHILLITKFKASNGSLSDSGISDGGTTSDGGLSERERRLGVLRRFAKQLESTLAPGSNAMKSIAARMESAEEELKNLQNSCRDLIVRTATSHQIQKEQKQQTQPDTINASNGLKVDYAAEIGGKNSSQQPNLNTPMKRKAERKQNRTTKSGKINRNVANATPAPRAGCDPVDDLGLEFGLDESEDKSKVPKQGWTSRIAKVALPIQVAFFTLLCAVCLMQPNCCDNLNNFSMSFTPQLRYMRGPPPI